MGNLFYFGVVHLYYYSNSLKMNRYILFFIVVAAAAFAYGQLINKEEFNALFAARVFFTACITTLLYFLIIRRTQRK